MIESASEGEENESVEDGEFEDVENHLTQGNLQRTQVRVHTVEEVGGGRRRRREEEEEEEEEKDVVVEIAEDVVMLKG